MAAPVDIRVDSWAGANMLVRFARDTGAVLTEAHEAIAKRHGVSTEGITVARPILMKDKP